MKRILIAFFLLHSLSGIFAQKPTTFTELQDSIKKIMEAEHIPGIMLAMVHRDSVIWSGGMGVSNVQIKTPVTSSTLFRIGSVTKTFTSLAIQRLIREGKFNLQSKLAEVAPEIKFTNQWETEAPVRIVNLLEHSAGFDDMHFKDFINKSGKKVAALEEAMAHKNALVSRWKPGTRSSYSNPGYMILGFIIEKYSGKPYPEYIAETVMQPLGMKSTSFNYETQEPYALGYSFDDEFILADPVVIMGGSAGAISSSADDMAKFVRMFLNDGQLDSATIIPASELLNMETQHSTLAAMEAGNDVSVYSGYGLGLYPKLHGDKKNRKLFYGHSGGIMGFGSDFGYSKELGVGFVISNNGETGNRKIVDLVVDYLTHYETKPMPMTQALEPNMVEPWLGHYRAVNSRNEILRFVEDLFATCSVYIDKDTVRVHPFLNDVEKFVKLKDNLYRKPNEPIATLALTKDGSSPIIFFNGDYLEKISPFTFNLHRLIIALGVIVSALLLLPGLFWLVQFIRKKISGKKLLVRTFPVLTIGVFIAMLLTFFALVDLKNIITSDSINAMTFTIFACSLLVPVLAIVQLIHWLRNRKESGRIINSFLGIAAVGNLYLAGYLFYYGWVGMQVWNF